MYMFSSLFKMSVRIYMSNKFLLGIDLIFCLI